VSVFGAGEVADLIKVAVNKIWPDKTEQEKAELAAAVVVVQGQLDVNKNEALHSNVFVSGWRPFIGWICGSALAYSYIGYPLLMWSQTIWFPHITPPVLGIDNMLYELLFGMLGLAGFRTFEKIKGVAR
jgi:hypothetical protein